MSTRKIWPMVVILSCAALMVALLGYYRWTLFIPHPGLIVARSVIGAVVMAALFTAAAIRGRHTPDPRRSFSNNSLIAFIGAALFGFVAAGMTTGAAAYLNGADAQERALCMELVEVGHLNAVVFEPGRNAARAAAGGTTRRDWTLDFRSYHVDLSGVKVGEQFDLLVLDGRFGHTVLRGQRPAPGCNPDSARPGELPGGGPPIQPAPDP